MSDPTSTTSPANAIDVVYNAFPWLRQLGLPISQLQEWVVQGLTGDALYSAATQTQQYQAMFPEIRRQDGTLRMSESQYLATEDQYRQLLKQYGDPSYSYSSPQDLAAFFAQEIDPNELKQRFDMYETVKNGSDDIKNAFYVYAGMKPSDDQLYWAMVSPTARAAMVDEYNQKVAASPLDYQTWITRATEAGLSSVQSKLQQLQQAGVVTDAAITQIQQVSPDFARQMMDLLYHGGDPSGQTTQLLNLDQLMHAFDYAMIGSAATANGLQLPGQDRINAIRDAGVTRDAALKAYGQFAQDQNLLSGEAARAGRTFGQNEFEQAVLLQQGQQAGELASLDAQEKALGHAGGAADVVTDQVTGRPEQRGLRESFA
jgi:hypothetical protein